MSKLHDSKRLPVQWMLACSLLCCAIAPGLAHAGAAGGSTIACEATAQLAFVIDSNDNGVRDPGETDPCTNPVVDSVSNPLEPVVTNGVAGPVCLPATVAQLRGTLTLIADDSATDNNIGGSQNVGQALTLILDVRHDNQLFRIADSFTVAYPITLASLYLGNWDNRLVSEDEIYGIAFKGSLFLTPTMQQGQAVTDGAFEHIGTRLSQIAEDTGLVGDATTVMPIVASATRDATRKRFVITDATGCGDSVADGCGELEVDEQAGPLASIAVYRLTIHFAEKLTTTAPPCS
jgi:hypothetical protein